MLDDASLPCDAGSIALWSDDDKLARVSLMVNGQIAPRLGRTPAQAVPPCCSSHDCRTKLNLDSVEQRAASLNACVSSIANTDRQSPVLDRQSREIVEAGDEMSCAARVKDRYRICRADEMPTNLHATRLPRDARPSYRH
jgi:hypothetical protein